MTNWRERLRSEIRGKGPEFKVTEFSEGLGFSKDFVTRMLKPNSNPTINNIERVCDGLGVSFVYIFSGHREEPVYDQIAAKMTKMSERDLQDLHAHLKEKTVTRYDGS